jgi:putative ABC transport system permease protein
MFKVALKSLLGHKLRLVLTGIAIILGTAFLSGSYILTDTLKGTFNSLFSEVGKNIDAVVLGPTVTPGDTGPQAERLPLDQSLLAQVTSSDGVAKAEGDISGSVILIDPRQNNVIGPKQGVTLSFAWSDDPDFSSVTVVEGRAPKADDETAIDELTLKKANLRVGDTVRVNATVSGEYTIVGSLQFGSDTKNLAGTALSFFTPEQAARINNLVGQYTQIAVVANEGTSPAQLVTNLQGEFPNLFVRTGVAEQQAQADSINEGLGFFGTFLSAFAYISLFVGSILIFNTFQIIVAQRSKELAVLRAIGARKGQVLRSVIVESLFTGLVFSALGAVTGILIARLIIAAFKAIGLDLPVINLVIGTNRLVYTVAVGVVVTFVASIVPSIQASRVQPVAALRDEVRIPTGARRARVIGGIVMLSISLAAIVYGAAQEKLSTLGLGAGLLLIAVLVASPILTPAILKVVSIPATKAFAFPTELGARNAERNPRRTAITAYALVIGVSLVVAIGILVASVTTSFDRILSDAIKSDFSVSQANVNSQEGLNTAIAQTLAKDPALRIVSPVRQSTFSYDGNTTIFVAVMVDNIDEVYVQKIVEGKELSQLGQNELIVRQATAEGKGWKVGDTIPVEFGLTGKVDLKLVGLSKQSGPQGIDYITSTDTFDANVPAALIRDEFIFVKGQPGADLATTRAALDAALKPFPEAQSLSTQELIKLFSKQLDQLARIIQALLAFSVLIAFFGVINTLLLSISERTRELGLLRAVGMVRTQVRRMIRMEAIFTVALGVVLGLAIGAGLSYAFIRALASQGFSSYTVPVSLLITCVLITPIAGLLAAWIPARRASNMNVLAAIQQI